MEADNGISMLDRRMCERFCSAFLCFTAMITNAFKITVIGEAMHKMATIVHGKTVSFKFYVKCGACGQ